MSLIPKFIVSSVLNSTFVKILLLIVCIVEFLNAKRLRGAEYPVGPVGPVAPVCSAVPVLPSGPVFPVAPVGPVTPVSPVAPVFTAVPSIPLSPVGPVITSIPLKIPITETLPLKFKFIPVCPNVISPFSLSIFNDPVSLLCRIFTLLLTIYTKKSTIKLFEFAYIITFFYNKMYHKHNK